MCVELRVSDVLLCSDTLFVSDDLRYLGPNVHVSIPLGPRDSRGGEVVIPCVPVGMPPGGSYRAKWSFSTDRDNVRNRGVGIGSGPHPADGAASVGLEPVEGNNGSIADGVLRISNLYPTVAGYYHCDVVMVGGDVVVGEETEPVASNTALLYCE